MTRKRKTEARKNRKLKELKKQNEMAKSEMKEVKGGGAKNSIKSDNFGAAAVSGAGNL